MQNIDYYKPTKLLSRFPRGRRGREDVNRKAQNAQGRKIIGKMPYGPLVKQGSENYTLYTRLPCEFREP